MDVSNPTQADNEKAVVENDNSSDKEDDVKMEDETEEEEDPEEDPEEDEEMENGSPQHDSSNDKKAEQEQQMKLLRGEIKVKDEVKESKADVQLNEEKEGKVDKSKKETPAAKEVAVDKELLQVEDMRLIIHSLGMFFSHRDVKHSNALFLKQELVQSALLESNTGRDDRILYNKVNKVALDSDRSCVCLVVER
ncbi:hypothetical protein SESBI_45786 [Sesbania bispinosa]|nr:hypothetical protein SESBI_45786 [Sesbania bispinosa]